MHVWTFFLWLRVWALYLNSQAKSVRCSCLSCPLVCVIYSVPFVRRQTSREREQAGEGRAEAWQALDYLEF